MTPTNASPPSVIHYFIDEAGDSTLFDRRGRRILVGDDASKYFMLGKLKVAHPDRLGAELNALRDKLLDDPYFDAVPSMQPDRKKTAIAFHAKDDLPEVRHQVFQVLRPPKRRLLQPEEPAMGGRRRRMKKAGGYRVSRDASRDHTAWSRVSSTSLFKYTTRQERRQA